MEGANSRVEVVQSDDGEGARSPFSGVRPTQDDIDSLSEPHCCSFSARYVARLRIFASERIGWLAYRKAARNCCASPTSAEPTSISVLTSVMPVGEASDNDMAAC